MAAHQLRVPDIVRSRSENLGDQGERWLAGLAAAVEYHERDWSLRLGEVLTGGSESLVVAAVCEDGTDAVLKIGLPGSADLAQEARLPPRRWSRLCTSDST